VSDDTYEPTRLAYWSEFHLRVQSLDAELRDVMDIVWYQGLSQAEAANILNVSERTVQRRWRQACLELHDALNGLPPGFQ
jgi:RNA polymerase sigma-70 factor (ECF subfamily)